MKNDYSFANVLYSVEEEAILPRLLRLRKKCHAAQTGPEPRLLSGNHRQKVRESLTEEERGRKREGGRESERRPQEDKMAGAQSGRFVVLRASQVEEISGKSGSETCG